MTQQQPAPPRKPRGAYKAANLVKIPFATRLAPYIIDELAKQGNQSAFIEAALLKALKLKKRT